MTATWAAHAAPKLPASRRSTPNRTHKLEEIVEISETFSDDAIRNAIIRASQTLRGLD